MRLAGAVSNLDRISSLHAIGSEAGQRLYIFIELNDGNTILGPERIEKTLAREFQLLAKVDRRARHIEHQYKAERSIDRLKELDRLFDSILVHDKIVFAQR